MTNIWFLCLTQEWVISGSHRWGHYPSKLSQSSLHDDVIKWKHFPRYWPFVRVIHRSPVKYPKKSQWRGALMFSLICACDSRRHRAHYDVTVMLQLITGDRMSCSQLMIGHQGSSLSNDHQDDTLYCTSSEKLTTQSNLMKYLLHHYNWAHGRNYTATIWYHWNWKIQKINTLWTVFIIHKDMQNT